ncbi:hypothetical protein BC941DRAFT_408236 [Chlamydoabsidia padenii]|nr:hypothetical protein BC941DRAFT_408236 [Chlamydoabsidia padenii]
MASPKNALILYNYHCYDKTQVINLQHLDILARLGCSGRIHLEQIHKEQSDSSRLEDIKQLLGLSGSTDLTEIKQTLSKRFGKMKVGMISNSIQVIDMAKAAGLTWTVLWKSSSTIDELVQIGYKDMDSGLLDCLVVDMTDDQNVDLSWKGSNRIIGDALDNRPSLLKCTVTRSSCEHQQDGQWTNLIPLQSHEIKDGNRIKVQQNNRYIATYFHLDTTRVDKVVCFDVDKMNQWGCNGSILAWHYLAEIGHKLGHVPKYGA